MKKMIMAIILIAAMVQGVSAQNTKRMRIVLTQDTSANSIAQIVPGDENAVEYKSINLSATNLKHITSFLPAEIALVEGEEGSITISYPAIEEEYVKFAVKNGELIMGRNGDVKIPKNTILSELVPIKVTISASNIAKIHSLETDLELSIERDKFASSLEIIASGAVSINGESITADKGINIISFGTMTINVKELRTQKLEIANQSYLHIKGCTTAQDIEHVSYGIDNITLDVDCKKLLIVSNGSGVITYTGSAENLDVVARGKAEISTSKLNIE